MNVSGLVLLALASTLAVAAPNERAVLKGVTAVRAGNYGAPSTWLRQHDEVAPIVEELNELRKKPWRRGDTKMTCYSTVILLASEKQVALFRMRPDMIVERPAEKGESSWSLKLADTDLPRLRKVLAEAPKTCE
jgi:hypothetical protein